MRMIFVNVPVADIARATAFYEAIGCTKNPAFSDATTSCMVLSDTIYFMIMEHERFQGFINGPIADPRAGTDKLIALSADSAEEVARLKQLALDHGGGTWRPDMEMPGMVQASVTDPDGHVIELFWMSQEAVAVHEANAAA